MRDCLPQAVVNFLFEVLNCPNTYELYTFAMMYSFITDRLTVVSGKNKFSNTHGIHTKYIRQGIKLKQKYNVQSCLAMHLSHCSQTYDSWERLQHQQWRWEREWRWKRCVKQYQPWQVKASGYKVQLRDNQGKICGPVCLLSDVVSASMQETLPRCNVM